MRQCIRKLTGIPSHCPLLPLAPRDDTNVQHQPQLHGQRCRVVSGETLAGADSPRRAQQLPAHERSRASYPFSISTFGRPASWRRACEPTMHADVGDPLIFSFPVRTSAAEERIRTGSLPHRQPLSSPISSTVDSSARWTRTATRAEYDCLRSFLFLFSRQRRKSRFCAATRKYLALAYSDSSSSISF